MKRLKRNKMGDIFEKYTLIDILGILGYIFAAQTAPRRLLVVADVVLIIYFCCRAKKGEGIGRWIRLLIAVLLIVHGISTIHEGFSIVKITASYKTQSYYTGDDLVLSDFEVQKIMKNGKISKVGSFEFLPTRLVKGKNVISINYGEYNTDVVINAVDPIIEQIIVNPTTDEFYVGDKLLRSDFNVVGIDSKGNKNSISNFIFSPKDILAEGTNTILFTYDDLQTSISINAKQHEIISIDAEYLGGTVFDGEELTADDFRVIATYDHGVHEEITDFDILNPVVSTGENLIELQKENCNAKVCITALEAPQGYGTIEPDSVFNQWSNEKWDANTDFDINGTRHKKGNKFTVTDMWHGIDSNSGESHLILTLFIPVNPEFNDENSIYSGAIILHNSMKNKNSYGEIKILIKDQIVFTTGLVDGDTRQEFPFIIDYSNTDSFEIVADCHVVDTDFVFGIVYDE